MADKAKNVVLNFKMDGQVQYANTLKQINAVMNTAAKEYKNHITAMGQDASMTDKLRAEKKKLEIQMEGAQKRTKMLRGEYEAMAKDTNTTTDQLTKMYSRLLDAENAELRLEKSLERVSGGLSEQALEARDAKENLEKLNAESKLLEAEQKSLVSAIKLQNAELEENASDVDKAFLAQQQLKSQMDLTERTVQNLERKLSQAKKVYGENSVEVKQLETKINDARTTIAKFSKSLDGIKESSENANDGLEGLGKKMDLNNLMEATEMLSGMTDSILNLGTAARDYALQFGDSQMNLQANLGITAEEAEKLNGVVDEVFKNGIVGSMEEASLAVVEAKKTFGDLDDVELTNLTNNITGISKRTGVDLIEVISGTQTVMRNFGLSGKESLDFIAYGLQNTSGQFRADFTDALTELIPTFNGMGATAQQAFDMMIAAQESGMENFDALSSLTQGFSDNIIGGSKDVVEGFKSLGGNAEETFKKFQEGGASAYDVFVATAGELGKMEDKTKANQLGVSLFGDVWTEAGAQAITSLGAVDGEMEKVNGKADEMAKKSPGEEWESSLRELQTALLPIGQQLIDGITPVVEMLADLSDGFTKLSDPVQTFIIAFGGILAVVGILAPIIMAIVGAFMLFGSTLGWIILIIVAVAAAIAGIIVAVQNWGSITDWISEKWSQFTSWIEEEASQLAEDFVGYMEDLKEGAVNKFEDLKEGASDKLNSLRDKASDVMQQAKEKILSPVEGARDRISEIVEEIKGFFSNLKLKIPKFELPSMPKFRIETSTKTIMGKDITYPTGFDVKWNAKGAIFTQPTIFGQFGGQLQGGGEAGPEAALPLTEENLGAIGRGIAATMQVLNGVPEVHVYLDTDELNSKLAPGMSKKINSNNKIGVRRVAFS